MKVVKILEEKVATITPLLQNRPHKKIQQSTKPQSYLDQLDNELSPFGGTI